MKNMNVSLLTLLCATLYFNQSAWSMEERNGDEPGFGKPLVTQVDKTKQKEASIEDNFQKLEKAKEKKRLAKEQFKQAKRECAQLKGKPEKQTHRKAAKQKIKEQFEAMQEELRLAKAAHEKAILKLEGLKEKNLPTYSAKLEVEEKKERAIKAENEVEAHQYDLSAFEKTERDFKRKVKRLKINRKNLHHRRQEAILGAPEVQYQLGLDLIKGGSQKVFDFRLYPTKKEEQLIPSNHMIAMRNKYGQTKKEKEGLEWLKMAAEKGHDKADWEAAYRYIRWGSLDAYSPKSPNRRQAIDYICRAASKGDTRAHEWYEQQKILNTYPHATLNLQVVDEQFVLTNEELEEVSKAVSEGKDKLYSIA